MPDCATPELPLLGEPIGRQADQQSKPQDDEALRETRQQAAAAAARVARSRARRDLRAGRTA